ncbi:hypothetical protein NQ314_018413, partial [Rhamnusium bicolor]
SISLFLLQERGWEYKQICVTRVPGYGFGIAVSGGRDNPHFASGDPSIAVSDVLASGPAERLLQVNDRIISVNGISLQNVDYATAVQVLRDSGDTVTLVIKRRTIQHSHSHSASFNGPPLAALGVNPLPAKVSLTKNSKKEDFGIVLGCKLFIKEISSKARDQLINTNQVLEVGDFLTKLNNTNCNDVMSLKEAKKIIDSTKDKLHITVARDFGFNSNISHQTQSSISTTGAVNNFYKGDDFLTSGPQSYSNQNLYVQPPTRNPNLIQNGGFDEKLDQNSGPNSLPDEKSNLAPRGRSRGPLSEANLNQLENRNSIAGYGRSKGRDEPPRPPPPRAEDYYSSRRQIYEDDPIVQKTKQPINYSFKVNDMDMTGVTREEAVLFLLSLQDRIELIVQFCKEEYDSIVASQKGDSFYIKTHFHYENPAKGEMSFRSGDIFHVIDTLYNGVVGCWQVFRIAEELATAQFNATKKEMSANESRGSFFKRRRSSNRRSKSLGKEHWDDILFSDTVSKFPAYERVLLKHPGFTRPVILFGPIADVAREKLLKDFPDKFISPQLDATVEETSSKSHKSSSNSNIIRLSAIRDVISTGKHALLDITPNAVERLNYAQMYPIVVFFKAETKMVVKQLRHGLPKSAHKSSKKLLEQCQKLDKVWSHVFSGTITLNDNTDTWYRKVREIIDKQQSGALWMSESKPPAFVLCPKNYLRDTTYIPTFTSPKFTSNPDPQILSPTDNATLEAVTEKPPLSMYSSPQFIHRTTPNTSCYAPCEYYPNMSPVTSQSTLYQENYPNASSLCSYDVFASDINRDLCFSNNTRNVLPYNLKSTHVYNEFDDNNNDLNKIAYVSESFEKDSLNVQVFKQSEPIYYDCDNVFENVEERDNTVLDPPTSPGMSGSGTTGGRLTKASSDPSVVMPDSSTTDVLPPYQQQSATAAAPTDPQTPPTDSPLTKDPTYTLSNPDIPSSLDPQGPYPNNPIYKYQKMNDARNEFGSRNDFNSPDRRTDFNSDRNLQHKRQASTLHNAYNHNKGHSISEQSPAKEGVYGQVPDLPPRVDRAVKPMGLLTTPNKIPNGRSAHERLFGTKANPQVDSNDTNAGENGNFNNKAGSLERSQNSKSSNTRIGPNAHDDLKTTLSKIDPTSTNVQNSPSKYSSGPRWDQNAHRHGSKLDLKYGLPPGDQLIDNSPRNSREIEKESSPMDPMSPRGSVERDMYRYSRSPAKQNIPGKPHMETKTDYGKYRSPPMHHNGYDSGPPNHMGPPNGNTYKPIPPPKPKNYKPPYKQGYTGDGMVQPPPVYQHGKSHSNPVDQRNQNMNLSPHHNYYYNTPPNHNPYHTEAAIRYQGGHYDMAPPYQESPRRHPSISYASRSEITPIAHQHENSYGMEHHPGDILDSRPPVVDLQGSREQRGSAFELYRKPVGHNMRGMMEQPAFYGSQPNIAHKLNPSSATNSPKITPKLTKTQSFKHQKSLAKRDITSAIVDHRGGHLVNQYWGVSLEVPEGAIPKGEEKQIYFVISDPRLCDNAPPLDLDNGETMLSPLVMCGPQGTVFLKPVILNIPHYANTLPSLGISLKATDSEQDIHTDWDNILLPSNHAANSVAVKVDHF